jgi:hypothetical protein
VFGAFPARRRYGAQTVAILRLALAGPPRIPPRVSLLSNVLERNICMLVLCHNESSICAAKVRLLLAEKDIPWRATIWMCRPVIGSILPI